MKKLLIQKLDQATDRATAMAMQRGSPLPISKKSTLIGNLVIEKNKD